MTRYVEAFSWTGTIERFLNEVVTERPILNVCAGRTRWGDVTLDRYEPAMVKGVWTNERRGLADIAKARHLQAMGLTGEGQ